MAYYNLQQDNVLLNKKVKCFEISNKHANHMFLLWTTAIRAFSLILHQGYIKTVALPLMTLGCISDVLKHVEWLKKHTHTFPATYKNTE